MRARLLLLTVCLFGLVGCRTGMRPSTPRVARAAGYELELTEVRPLGMSDPGLGGQKIEVAARALPRDARVVWMGVADAGDEPCSLGIAAARVYRRKAARGERIEGDFSVEAWQHATRGPSRLDVLVEESSGVLRCAAFPLIDERPQTRWSPLESWTLAMVISGDFLLRDVDGLHQLFLFGAELGKWVGPVRLHAVTGGGVSVCERGTCAAMADDRGRETDSQTYYIPLHLGAELPLLQAGPVVLDMRAQYRVGVTAADTYSGMRRSFLHGPLLTPALTFTMPDPIAPGVPGGTRRGFAVSLQAPVGYVMSSRGGGSASLGFGVVLMCPLR